MSLLFVKPVLKEMIWGGNRLQTDFGYEIPSQSTGECWAVSAHPNGDCQVYTKEGDTPFEGKSLSELWENNRELFGNMQGDQFPLLTKIIDAKTDLSIQVHPNDEYAKVHENSLGKTECWYILDCDPDATIVIGHHAKSQEELREMIEEGRFDDLIRVIPIHPGDFFQINPGCVHAIKGGTLLLETQQNSDVTYRLYDYGRLQNGKPRELHLEKSMDVITCPMETAAEDRRIEYGTESGSSVEHLVTCEYYTVEHIQVKGSLELKNPAEDVDAPAFQIFSVVRGEGSLDGVEIKKGEHFIVPNGYEGGKLTGEMELIRSVAR